MKPEARQRLEATLTSPPARGRGLKQCSGLATQGLRLVAPRAGAWIETSRTRSSCPSSPVAPRAGAWIETVYIAMPASHCRRRPPRGGVD